MGNRVEGARMGLYGFDPRAAGDVNRPFVDVAPGSTYCYEDMRGGRTVGQLPLRRFEGVLLVSLTDESTPRVEGSACDAVRPWGFSGEASTFRR